MTNSGGAHRPYRRLIQFIYLVAIVIGLKYGYDFGNRISGMILGVVVALNAAVFCVIIISVVVERLERLMGVDREQP